MRTATVTCAHTGEAVGLARELTSIQRTVLRILVLAALAEGDRTAREISQRLGWSIHASTYYCSVCNQPYLGPLAQMVQGTESVGRALRWNEARGRVRRVVLGGTRAQLWSLVAEVFDG
jgi:hypothetical protein